MSSVGSNVRTLGAVQALSEKQLRVGASLWTWWLLVPLLVGILLLLPVGAIRRPGPRTFLLAFSAMLLGWSLLAGLWLLARRRWLTILPEGFRLQTPWGATDFLDEQVLALADDRRTRFASGQPLGDLRRCRLRLKVGQQVEQISLLRYLGLEELDPLDVLIERLKCRLFEQAQWQLRRRESIRGRLWQWTGDELEVRGRQGLQRLKVDSLSHVSRVGHQILLWQSARATPVAALPAGDENVWLLEECLRAACAERVVLFDAATSPEFPLGRVLSERRPSQMVALSMYALGSFAAVVALVCLVGAVISHSWIPALLGVCVGVPGVMVAQLGRQISKVVFRIGEVGIEKCSVHDQQRLLFEEIAVLQFDAQRQRSHGRYVGTLYTLTFAHGSDARRAILHSETTPHEDPQLLELRDRVAAAIAVRMAREYARSGEVRWTPELTLNEGMILFRPLHLYGWGRRPATVAFEEVLDFGIDGDWFHLWTIANDRAQIKVKTSTPNFYAGLLLLENLCSHMDRTLQQRMQSLVDDEPQR